MSDMADQHNEAARLDPQDVVLKIFRKHVEELSQSLQERNIAAAFSAIEHMHAAREESIYHALGMLTRGLNTAIVNFSVDDQGKAYLAHDEDGIAPVTSQLENVVRMSEDSARRTLNVLEESLPLVQRMREEAESCSENPDLTRDVLSRQCQGLAALESSLMDILMAQTYQDLAGQAIRKVNCILGALQTDLVVLLTFAKRLRSISQPVPLRHPVMEDLALADETGEIDAPREVPLSQDAVNDLLSSLGF